MDSNMVVSENWVYLQAVSVGTTMIDRQFGEFPPKVTDKSIRHCCSLRVVKDSGSYKPFHCATGHHWTQECNPAVFHCLSRQVLRQIGWRTFYKRSPGRAIVHAQPETFEVHNISCLDDLDESVHWRSCGCSYMFINYHKLKLIARRSSQSKDIQGQGAFC